jgi:formylglycine-generating enzyme required for sulfatase activity
VVNVSWNDAVKFCEWLSQKEKRTYRLPTEAEWEYACRAGTSTRYWSGDDDASLKGVANVADESLKAKLAANAPRCEGWDDGQPFTAPVGSFKPNRWGLYDMHGNVRQWCADWYDSSYYRSSPRQGPKGPAAGTRRVWRGGSWLTDARLCRSAYRFGDEPTFRHASFGFRVALDAAPPP